MLSKASETSKDLWLRVKPLVRQIENDDGVLIVDESILEKPSTDESPLSCHHYNQSQGRTVKGINFISAVYHNQDVSLPVGVHLVMKPDSETDAKTGKRQRNAWFTKNHHCRALLAQAVTNQRGFRYVLTDIWFASSENLRFIRHELNKHFVMPLKSNRKVALSLADKKRGHYVKIDTRLMEAETVREVWLEGVDFPVTFVKQLFTNEEGSTGILYLVSSQIDLSNDQISTIYQKRWNVECYNNSLKQKDSFGKSPTKTRTTQTNHFFASLSAYLKLEQLKIRTKLNHLALKHQLYVKAVQQALAQLRKRQNANECVT